MTRPSVISAATCLGCGCTCDDIEVVLDQSTILSTRNTCALGAQWFDTGAAPARARVNGHDVSLDEAVEQAATILAAAARPRVLLGPDLSCEAYGEAIACADLLRARLDATSSASSMATLLAMQERGIAGATLGEIRNRADVIVFWGVDPAARYPRYQSRYAPGPAGVHVPNGRTSRTVVAVDVGDARGPLDADLRVELAKEAEVDTLITLGALLSAGSAPTNGVGSHSKRTLPSSDSQRAASMLAGHLRNGRYVVVVADVESAGDRGLGRIHRLLALGHALNTVGRGALSLLRGAGNRSGAEAVMTRQTGYPGAIDFASRTPRYRPHADPSPTAYDGLLVLGSAAQIPTADVDALGGSPAILIGPRASESGFRDARVVIDSATAGIHAGGTAVRMDDVPIALKRLISGPPDAAVICQDLRRRLQKVRGLP